MRRKLNVPGLRLSLLVYRWFLKLHSAQFQAQSGGEMMLHHEDAYCNAWMRGRWCAIGLLWLHEILDLPSDVASEYKPNLKPSKRMGGKLMKWFVATVALLSSETVMILAGLVGAAVWVVVSSSGVFQNGIEQSIWFLILFDGPIAVVGLLCVGFWTQVAAEMR